MAAIAREWVDWARAQAQAHVHLPTEKLGENLGVKLTLPPKSFFKFPPSNIPTTLPPPLQHPNFENPFAISTEWYNALLSPTVPITFALVYATVITYLNSVNKQRNHKPWAISKTGIFKLFVVLHNIFLTLYSLWTCIGMVNALRASIVDPRECGMAATVDSFCKMNGPRGYGSAATFNERNAVWRISDHTYHLAANGLPDSTDVGRIWNEGLAYYGWLFYVSKFYEVVDTLIIIAKGKKSSFLQIYHHFGAMLCMWAGIRYMSPPIWMFVTVNSFIHTIMYSFYTLITLGIKVPKSLKRILTTLQITQFVVGVIYAFGHYFIAYRIPISVPYLYHLGDVIHDTATSITSNAASAVSIATATASADAASWLKKLAFRAAGREGLAENVENQQGQTFGIDAVHAAKDLVSREETRYRNQTQWVHCLDTSGQTFAIWLNIFYLAPLTWLFLQFFIKSYLERIDERRRSSVGERAYIAKRSITDAGKGVSRRLSEAFEDYQGANGDTNDDYAIVDAEEVRNDIRSLAKKAQKSTESFSKTVSDRTSDISQAVGEKTYGVFRAVRDTTSNVTETVSNTASNAYQTVSEKSYDINTRKMSKQVQESAEAVKSRAEAAMEKGKEELEQSSLFEEMKQELRKKTNNTAESAKKSVENVTNEQSTSNAADTAEKVKQKAGQLATDASKKLEESVDQAKDKAQDVKQDTKKGAEDATDAAKEKTSDVKQGAKNSAEGAADTAKGKTSKVKQGVKTNADKAAESAKEKTSTVQAGGSKNKDAANNKSSQSQTTKTATSKDQSVTDAIVQQRKSFAAVAAEGVPEEETGENKVLEDDEDADELVKKADDEGA